MARATATSILSVTFDPSTRMVLVDSYNENERPGMRQIFSEFMGRPPTTETSVPEDLNLDAMDRQARKEHCPSRKRPRLCKTGGCSSSNWTTGSSAEALGASRSIHARQAMG